MTEERKKFRAGDYVQVFDSKGEPWERWVLAVDEDNQGYLTCAGWPETRVEAEKCQLIKAATDEERLDMLSKVSEHHGYSYRSSLAKSQLAAETV
jgi:hypothetical protein